MAFTKHTLCLITIFVILFSIQCFKVTSSKAPTPTPTPSSTSDDEELSPTDEDSSPTDEDSSTPNEDSSPAPTPNPLRSSGPTADSPLSISELMELSLPEIGVQKASVGPDPEGTKVANKQLEGIERKIDEFKGVLTKRATAPNTSGAAKKCLAQCQDNLEEAMDGVKTSIESIKNQDLRKANIDISGIATDIETCNDCFIELDGEDKDVNAFNEWIKGVTKECLNNLKKT